MKLTIPDNASLKADLEGIGKAAPFAVSLGLNALANRAQQAIKDHVGGGKEFTLRRRQFVLNTIKRERGADFATRRQLSAAVRIDPDPKRDFLVKFVDGGVKRPLSGSSLMVPVGVRGRGAGGIITTAQRAALRVDPKVARIRTGTGTDLLVRFSGRGKRARADVLFRLVPQVPIRPRLPIYDLARDTFDAHWLDAMRDAIMEAMIRNVRGSRG